MANSLYYLRIWIEQTGVCRMQNNIPASHHKHHDISTASARRNNINPGNSRRTLLDFLEGTSEKQ